MRIALIGATGFTGRAILDELLRRDHSVRALIHRAAPEPRPGLDEVRADVDDLAALTAALAGVDAVVSAFNPGWSEPDLYEKFMRGARNIVSAAKTARVPRLLVVGGSASLYGPDGRQFIETMTIPAPYDAGVRAARDFHAEILAETQLDWVFLSPPPGFGPVGPTARLGHYRVGLEAPVFDGEGQSQISAPDLAIAVADEVETPRHHRQRFTVGY